MLKATDLQVGQIVRVSLASSGVLDVTIGGFAEMNGQKLLLTVPGYFKGEPGVILAWPIEKVTHVLTPVGG